MTEPSSSVVNKARDYLAQGRVKVVSVVDNQAEFLVSGSDEKPYVVKHASDWTCTCFSRVLVCSHVFACQLITNFEPTQRLFSPTSEVSSFLNS